LHDRSPRHRLGDRRSRQPQWHDGQRRPKREAIRKALDLSGGNIAQAGRQLKLQPTYLHRLIKNLGLRDGGS
jgi:transcriptional regulator with GAF, ATPase, and Fis domain